jgi:hypothetical protein
MKRDYDGTGKQQMKTMERCNSRNKGQKKQREKFFIKDLNDFLQPNLEPNK